MNWVFLASYTFGGVNDLTVKSSKFTTKIMSIFEGAKLVYYTNNVKRWCNC